MQNLTRNIAVLYSNLDNFIILYPQVRSHHNILTMAPRISKRRISKQPEVLFGLLVGVNLIALIALRCSVLLQYTNQSYDSFIETKHSVTSNDSHQQSYGYTDTGGTFHNSLALKAEQEEREHFYRELFPKVFIIPIPQEFHKGLLKCGGFDAENYMSIEAPFGPLEVDNTTHDGIKVKITPHHPSRRGEQLAEYDGGIYFHTMMEGYFNRVHDPEQADLFYVPIYLSRWFYKCHDDATTGKDGVKRALIRFANILAPWSDRFPAKSDGGPIFFNAEGAVCACGVGDNNQKRCNPIWWQNDTLAQKLRVVGWERQVDRPRHQSNIVMPYMNNLHDMPWDVEKERKLLVMAVIGIPRKKCVNCGPCYNYDTGKMCGRWCRNIRPEITEHMRRYGRNASDALLWTPNDGPSWPPRNVQSKMLEASFCLQPAGDTLSRNSFFQGALAGCIPVVFRNDDDYMEQLPFSYRIPYREIIFYVPEECVVFDDCGEGNQGGLIELLRQLPQEEIFRRRRLLKEYGRLLTFSAHNGTDGGYNDITNPDALVATLQETWWYAKHRH